MSKSSKKSASSAVSELEDTVSNLEPVPPPPQPAPSPPAVPMVRIVNRMTQMLTVQVNKSGKPQHVGIPAKGSVLWPAQADYGPDVKVKLRQKLVLIETA